MEKNDIAVVIAVVAVILALSGVYIAMTSTPVPVQGAWDPTQLSSVLYYKEPLPQTGKAFSGEYIGGQLINDSYVGQLVYPMGNGAYWMPADPGTAAKITRLGVVAQKPTANGTADAVILLKGLVYNSTWSFTKGQIVYANTTPGYMNAIRPAVIPLAVGWAYNTSSIYFDPMYNMSAIGL